MRSQATLAMSTGARDLRLLLRQFANPIIGILALATAVSMAVGDTVDGAIILGIVLASGLLGFWQERSAGNVVEALLRRVRVHVEVVRDGTEQTVTLDDVVPGDLVVLRAGDVVPGDGVVVEADRLLVDESALTGESFAAEKAATVGDRTDDSIVAFGTHVLSGTGRILIEATGADTELGAVARELEGREVTTRFEEGLRAFGALLARAMAVLVTAIFAINVLLDRPLLDSLLFSLALAVGLTPQLLPAIVAIGLATGARHMAAEGVIVKRLDAIEDFGSLDVLCTDKTGTLTIGVARLDHALDLAGSDDAAVLELARRNAGLQTGFRNPLDDAILAGAPPIDRALLLDELPYDFTRKRLSVLVDGPVPTIITKGALASVLGVCSHARVDGGDVPIQESTDRIEREFSRLSGLGFRVLGIATGELPGRRSVGLDDEAGLVLRGFLAFADAAKPDAARSIAELAALGTSVRLVTGDNRLAAAKIAREVGLDADDVVTGTDLTGLSGEQLAARCAGVSVFAEVEPIQKERIVEALRSDGATVGFLGDGINDAAALRAADVGISVDTAVDVAKQAADIVLLDKDLGVIADGARLGRRTFANTLKYIRVTISANFGNVLSMAAAATFLPYLPLLPRQILLLNFLSDIPATAIAGDRIDPEQLARPRSWDVAGIRRFMVVFGLVSSAFDLLTFAILRIGFEADAVEFHSAWFIASTATELTAMLVLRTRRPSWRSRPAGLLVALSALVALVTVALPYAPLAEPLGMTGPPLAVLLAIGGLTLGYATANEVAKRLAPHLLD